ncbi:ferrous iron transporter B [Parasphingorhabdus halotolerans]|uniref:Ferrous iron transport protein B n=1 Tax=Parasphingorhabdus halotolerans TaxID=2725558 RepID=A0A6H2DKD6_9SPHN|nr:ferrous iron transporter B [Parasphingorhabdus halotolerans]QJB69129.1 ferrous iron transporter B [Parasphingorhabdus halotolerans]
MTKAAPLIVLAGNPNAGKSALFNALTGARQKIANYPGVTVERKSGHFTLPDGRPAELVDLPGSYSLEPTSPDEEVTRGVITGEFSGERKPDAIIIVLDAANLDNHLRFALEVIALGRPVVCALNMMDLAERDGLTLDPEKLEKALGVPVVPTVAVRRRGLQELSAAVETRLAAKATDADIIVSQERDHGLRKQAKKIASQAVISETAGRRWSERTDAVLLHPFGGPLILMAILFVMFQAVFAWSEAPIGWIEAASAWAAGAVEANMAEGFLRDFIIEGAIAGVGSVVVFLPQILILFLFILLLEASGYMTRAAFIMDRMMAGVGLSGRSFIPLLSSFACAIPGIMATRSISDPNDRLTTILVAPLMTCSARLPVYAIIIGAFIPPTSVGPGIGLQGLVLFGLYLFGIVGAMVAALLLRRTVTKGPNSGFLMEMPKYQLPRIRDVALGLWQRAYIFMRRAGTIIFAATVILWFMLSFPKVPIDSPVSQVDYSAAGRIANVIEPIVTPIGFNRDIALALIPAMAAREVAVAALATTYAIDAPDEEAEAKSLTERLQSRWSLPTALAFLAWFVFAPQCISTIAVTRRETNGWKWPMFMLAYLFGLAYLAAGITYWTAVALGL